MESYTNISNSIIDDENLDPYEKTVLIYLVRLNNKTFGYSFPKKETMENVLKISPKKLTKTLRALQEKGYITIKQKPCQAGKKNIYYINDKYLVGQETSSQASTKPNTDNKSNNKKKQATEPQEDLDYKLGYIETSVNFTRDFRDTELEELKEVDMKIIERVCEEMRGETDISPFVFLLDLQKCKRGIN
jgi:DNA-binding PadR family transcriptional regulator